MGMMLKNLVHPYIQSTTVLCDYPKKILFGTSALGVHYRRQGAKAPKNEIKSEVILWILSTQVYAVYSRRLALLS